MITEQTIEEVKKRLVNTYDPFAIYLFGSYARGTQNQDSDLDLAIIIKEYSKDRHSLLVDGHRALYGLKIPKDLFIFSCDEFERYSKDQTRLSFTILNEGKKIYAKS